MYYDAEIVHRKEINSARSEGRKEGIKEGANDERKSIAKNLLKDGLPIPKVCKYTGLSKKQVSMLM